MPFEFEFTKQHLKIILDQPESDAWYDAMTEILPKWKVVTKNRVAAFLAQTAYESGNYRTLQENLNYSARRLRTVFPRYFPTDALAAQYQNNPEKIANRIYDDANRTNKLGNTEPGDGWLYRGRGIIQLTGKSNYLAFAADMKMTLPETIKYVETKKGALESACWFWNRRRLNSFADAGNIDQISRLINGGEHGLIERRKKFQSFSSLLASAPAATPAKPSVPEAVKPPVAPKPVAPAPTTSLLKKGSRGAGVKKLQEALGISADGIFGAGTETALKQWQTGAGLTADGVAGPETLKRLFK